jgi:RNA polymerase sigma-70 factor (ECF subfamily)
MIASQTAYALGAQGGRRPFQFLQAASEFAWHLERQRAAMSEEEIIRGICSGGRAMDAALKALYGSLGQHMLKFFVHKGVSGDEAKDILQETFIKVVRSANSYSGDGSARSWIWQVARNCLLDFHRKQSRIAEEEVAVNDDRWQMLEETTAAPTGCAQGLSADECVSRGLEVFAVQMPDRALALSLFMDGFSMAEIGEQIGRAAGATKTFVCECRKKIQPFIAHCAELLTT